MLDDIGDNAVLKVVSEDLWSILRRKAEVAKSRRAAIAYVTDGKLLRLQRGDLLVTDASDAAIAGARTSADVLAHYFHSGVELFSLDNLHAKVALLDDWAIVGSANASQHSATYFVEAAVITDRPELVGQTEKLIASLTKIATPIDTAFISRISAIPVTRPGGVPPGNGKRRKGISLAEQRFWFLGISDDEPYPGDSHKVDAAADKLKDTLSKRSGSVEWFWWHTSSRFAQVASVGDIVIDCWRPHAEIRSTKPIRVYRHAHIAQIVHERGVNARAFLCVWPPNSDESARSWKSFVALTQRAGIKRRLTPKSAVELTAQQSSALHELWGS